MNGPATSDAVVVHHLDEAGPAGTLVGHLGDACFVEVDALTPGRFCSFAAPDQGSGTAARQVESWADLVRQPVTRLALWTAVVLVAGGPAVVERIGAAIVEPPWPNVLRSGGAAILVLRRADLDLPEDAMAADPTVRVDQEQLALRVTVCPAGRSERLWARIHRGRERLFVATLRVDGAVLVADLLLPGGQDSLVVDVVDRLTAPAPIDGPALARTAVKVGLQSMAATASAVAAARGEHRPWAEASAAWLGAGEAWDDLSDHGRAGIAAAIALHAARRAGSDQSAAAACRLRDRTIIHADPASVRLATDDAVSRLLGRPPAGPDVISPLLEPRLRAIVGRRGPLQEGGTAARLDEGLDRLGEITDTIDGDPALLRTAALGLRGWSLACEILDRPDLAARAAVRSGVLSAGI